VALQAATLLVEGDGVRDGPNALVALLEVAARRRTGERRKREGAVRAALFLLLQRNNWRSLSVWRFAAG
jgi:hypothetical protein